MVITYYKTTFINNHLWLYIISFNCLQYLGVSVECVPEVVNTRLTTNIEIIKQTCLELRDGPIYKWLLVFC